MRDLLTDIEGPNSLDSLANLEKELDDINDSNTSSTFMSSNLPPGLSSGVTPSAGAMVVGHATQSYTEPSLPSSPQDAFAKSLQQFSALSLTDDFLQADSARKQANVGSTLQDLEAKKNEEMLIQNLFEGEEEYDVQAASEKVTGDTMAKLFSGLASAASMSRDKTNVKESERPVQQQQQFQPSNSVPPPPMNPPLGGSGPMRPPPMNMAPPMVPGPSGPMMMRMPPPGSMPPPPQMMMGMPPPHMVPPGSAPHVMMMMQQQQQQQQQQMQQQAAIMQQQLQQPQRGPPPSVSERKFTKSDFPALGAKESDVEKERFEEAKLMEEERIANASRENAMNVYRRITFANPNPDALPVPATAIRCTSMTPRDLCYVLHSMMRPILSFSSVLDAYNADYYRWSYEDRKSRNLLFVGGSAPSFQNNLPTPVWKETKVKAQEMEDSHRDKLEKRAENWTKEKQALGRVVKVNVKRPKALLSTNTLSTSADGLLAEHSEEDRQRALLWSARLAIDKGYQAYLNLIELRRLLQSRPSDALMEEEERKQTLLKDVEENVSKLQSAFGLKAVDSGTVLCDNKILSKTLTLSKGRMLLSRVIDEGILPHPSACKVLPSTISVVFEFASNSDLKGAPPAGEERLLRSLTGLVKTVRPSVDSQNLLACLMSATDAKTVLVQKNLSMKSVLTSKRALMELLHAIFERGSYVCVGDAEAEWKDRESKFLAILAES
jgi:hypothetical protein